MAWESIEWVCGHTGSMQLSPRGRYSMVAYEAGKNCMACWLIDTWKSENDSRANNPRRWEFATAIAASKGIRIYGTEVKESIELSKVE